MKKILSCRWRRGGAMKNTIALLLFANLLISGATELRGDVVIAKPMAVGETIRASLYINHHNKP